jgi:hypothetical protein
LAKLNNYNGSHPQWLKVFFQTPTGLLIPKYMAVTRVLIEGEYKFIPFLLNTNPNTSYNLLPNETQEYINLYLTLESNKGIKTFPVPMK